MSDLPDYLKGLDAAIDDYMKKSELLLSDLSKTKILLKIYYDKEIQFKEDESLNDMMMKVLQYQNKQMKYKLMWEELRDIIEKDKEIDLRFVELLEKKFLGEEKDL